MDQKTEMNMRKRKIVRVSFLPKLMFVTQRSPNQYIHRLFLQKLTSLGSFNLGKVTETLVSDSILLEYYMTSLVTDFGDVHSGLSFI